jgi:hypothetical protein
MEHEDRIAGWLQHAVAAERTPIELGELSRSIACQASCALPRSSTVATDEGAALMSLVRLALSEKNNKGADVVRAQGVLLGISQAELQGVLEDVRRWEWIPPAGALGPLRLAYTASGEVEITDRFEAARALPPGTLAVGFVDMVWSTPEPLELKDGRATCPRSAALAVAEYQIERANVVRPVRLNPTLMATSMLASKWSGANTVVPRVIRLKPGEGLHERGEQLSIHDLRVVELELRNLLAQIEYHRSLYDSGQPLLFREGSHCIGCASAWICPAYNKAARALLDRIDAEGEPTDLEDHEAVELALAVEQMQQFVAGARKSLRQHVNEHGPIDLRDGRVWGPYERTVRSMYSEKATQELAKIVGDDLANEATTLSQEQATRALRAARSRGIALNVEDSLALLMERTTRAGGMKSYPVRQWGPHPKEEQ